MSLHKEISFEAEVCEHLAASGWLYTEGEPASAAVTGSIDVRPMNRGNDGLMQINNARETVSV
ncbi:MULTISPECIES: hypothetical protein [unclassified Mesorhizobium]|uniref:hypothetical protein n=1 Tax=unclassified Mesorhizobium TaxID=325217 RepID=UPI00333A0F38